MGEISLEKMLEGVLFYKASPQKKPDLCKLLSCTEETLADAVNTLKERLAAGGTSLIETDSDLQLVSSPELDEIIESMRKDELKRDIGKAGAETLSIVLYKGPITRVEIDRIRGVNSGFILRNLLIRGLVERSSVGRTHSFEATPALLAHLGITNKTELPDYSVVLDQLEAFEKEIEMAHSE